jgi:hypothetical protein
LEEPAASIFRAEELSSTGINHSLIKEGCGEIGLLSIPMGTHTLEKREMTHR